MKTGYLTATVSRFKGDFQLSIITILGSLVLITLTPFTITRLVNQQYLIFALDLAVMLSALGIMVYCWVSRNSDRGATLLISAMTAGLGIAAYVNPTLTPYWLYCVVLFNFALATPNKALFFLALGFAVVVSQANAFASETIRSTYIVTFLSTVLFAYVFAMRNEHQKSTLMVLARTDALTGAANRRAFDEEVNRAVHTLERDETYQIAIASLDIDYFKKINDQFGHEVGDDVLVAFVRLLSKNIRKTDKLFRMGGEEFAILMANSDSNSTQTIAEKLCELVRRNALVQDRAVTVSIGASCLTKIDTVETWVKRADCALYKAKSLGRDQVVYQQAE